MRVEVDEIEGESAFHHAMGGDWRIDSAGEQSESAPGDSDWKASGAGYLAGRDVCGVVHDFYGDGELGVGEIDFEAERLLHVAADCAIDFDGVHREAFVLATGADRESFGAAAGRALDGLARHRCYIAIGRVADREILQTEN